MVVLMVRPSGRRDGQGGQRTGGRRARPGPYARERDQAEDGLGPREVPGEPAVREAEVDKPAAVGDSQVGEPERHDDAAGCADAADPPCWGVHRSASLRLVALYR